MLTKIIAITTITCIGAAFSPTAHARWYKICYNPHQDAYDYVCANRQHWAETAQNKREYRNMPPPHKAAPSYTIPKYGHTIYGKPANNAPDYLPTLEHRIHIKRGVN
jgi:hypothetical protein